MIDNRDAIGNDTWRRSRWFPNMPAGRAAKMHFSAWQRAAESLTLRDYSKVCIARELNRI